MAEPENPSPMLLERPCPQCAEKVLAQARRCRFCQGDLLVSLYASEALTNLPEKELHRLALQLMGVQKGLVHYAELKKLLCQSQKPLFPPLTFDLASKLKARAKTCEMILELRVPISPPIEMPADDIPHRQSFTRGVPWIFGTIVFVGLGVLGLSYYRQPGPPAPAISTPPQAIVTAPSASKNEATNEPKRNQVQEILIRATVTIADGKSVGSGFFVSADGFLVTNAHVVENMASPRVILESGMVLTPKLWRLDRRLDIALLKVGGNSFPFLALGDATSTSRGDTVWTVGAPHGLSFSLTKGIVSFVGRNMNGIAYLQTDAPINGGNSGGPMINEKGEVIGINTFIVRDSQGLGFALPINYLNMIDNPILESVVATRLPSKAMSDWLAFDQVASATGRTIAPPNTNAHTSKRQGEGMLELLLKDSQRLDNDFQRMQNQLKGEIAALTNQRRLLDSKYRSAAGGGMSVSAEANLGEQVRQFSQAVAAREMQLAEKSVTYYDAKQSNLKQAITYADNAAMHQQLENALATVEQYRSENRQMILQKQQEITQLNSKAY